jgi:rhodanese-related sulfurtransferase
MPLPEFQQLVSEAKKEIKEIDVAELKRMQQSGEDFALIDVREPDETAQGTIPGATTIPRGWVEAKIDTVTTDKNKKVVLYCAGGGRSALTAVNLKRMGFNNALNLGGGYKAWKESR